MQEGRARLHLATKEVTMRDASRRYGGMHLVEALNANSPYCLVTQVRSTSRHRRTLQSLGLGTIGRSVVVPRTDSLVGALKSVTPFIVAIPIDGPEQAAGVRLRTGRRSRPW
jgi:ribosomal protein L30/L7E